MYIEPPKPVLYKGIPVSDGLTFAPVVRFEKQNYRVPASYPIKSSHHNANIGRFYTALATARDQIDEIAQKTRSAASSNEASIFDSHIMMLEDTFFIDTVISRVRKESINIESIVFTELEKMIQVMNGMGDDYMRERVTDLIDVRNRLMSLLLGKDEQRRAPEITRPSVIIADNITPSDAVSLPREFIRGMATERGSITAHVTLLARALSLPAIIGINQSLDAIKTGDEVAIDGFSGELWHHPSDDIKAKLFEKTREKRTAIDARKRLTDQPAITSDGVHIHLFANTDHSVGFQHINEYGAEGIGLYRTEYLWIAMERTPTEEEQYQAYSEVLRYANSKPVTLRVLDIGGDKMVNNHSHMAGGEDNPFLGNRSIRYLLNNKDIFRSQVRAILRAAITGDCRMMYPMIANLKELLDCNAFVKECKDELVEEGIPFKNNVPIGIMIEVPSAVILTPILAQHTDFFSIGTNDLVQYAFAVDRGNESVAHLYQPFDPVILHLIKQTLEGAKLHGRPVCVCGEMASSPMGALLLIGLGVRELSMSATFIPRIKEVICRVAYYDIQRLLDKIKREKCSSPESVIAYCKKIIPTCARK